MFETNFVKILWPIPNPWFCRQSKIGSKEIQICISSTIGEKMVKTHR